MISISLIVVLLAAYSYSLPVPPQIQSSTSQIPFTTGQTSFGISSSTYGYLAPGSQTTSVSSVQPEITTLNPRKVQGHVPRGIQQSTVLTSTVPLSTSSQTIVNNKLNQFSSTTMETKASFNKKAIDGETADLEEEQTESKRAVSSKYVRPSSTMSYSTPISSTTVVTRIIGKTSSPQSFRKINGQMKNKRGEYYEQDEQKREFDQEQQDEQQDEQKREFDQEQQDEQQDEQKREFNEEQQDEQQDAEKREFNEEQQDEQQDAEKREFTEEQQDEQQDEQKREFDQEQQDEEQDEQKRAIKENKHHKQRKPYSGGQPRYEKGQSNYGQKQPVGYKTKSNY